MYESIKSNFRRIVAAHCVLENFIALERTGNVGGAPRYSDCFVYILSGRARYEFSDYSFVVSAGEILYLPKGGVYEIEKLTDEYRFIFVDFDFESDGKNYRGEALRVADSASAEKLFRKMDATFLERAEWWQPLLLSALYEVYACVMRCGGRDYRTRAVVERVRPACEAMLSGYADPDFSVAALGEKCGLKESQFRRLFSEAYGVSPVRYLTRLRLGRAKALLESGDCSISAVAAQSGFSDEYYFNRAFTKNVGITPGKYAEFKSKYRKV